MPEVRRRARHTFHHAVGRKQAQLALRAIAEAAAVTYLDRFPGDVLLITAVNDLGHGIAVKHAIQHAFSYPVPTDPIELLAQVICSGLVDRTITAGINLPLTTHYRSLPLLPYSLDLPIAQQLLIDLDVCAGLAQQRVGRLR